jgi:hypothetical protein
VEPLEKSYDFLIYIHTSVTPALQWARAFLNNFNSNNAKCY